MLCSPDAEVEDSVNNLCSTAHFALHLRILVGRFNKQHNQNFKMRIGLAYGGPVIAGVRGRLRWNVFEIRIFQNVSEFFLNLN